MKKGVERDCGLPRFNNSCSEPVPRYQARVLVHLRPSVLDPAGEATRSAASRLGVEGIERLRIGKAVELELEASDEEGRIESQCEPSSDLVARLLV